MLTCNLVAQERSSTVMLNAASENKQQEKGDKRYVIKLRGKQAAS